VYPECYKNPNIGSDIMKKLVQAPQTAFSPLSFHKESYSDLLTFPCCLGFLSQTFQILDLFARKLTTGGNSSCLQSLRTSGTRKRLSRSDIFGPEMADGNGHKNVRRQ
jgi:hypothetical protein